MKQIFLKIESNRDFELRDMKILIPFQECKVTELQDNNLRLPTDEELSKIINQSINNWANSSSTLERELFLAIDIINFIKQRAGKVSDGNDGWISVKKETPKKNDSVMASDILGYPSIVDEWDDLYVEKFNITHWQNLPSPPSNS